MNFLHNIQWHKDWGVQLDMLNDKNPVGRNRFYQKVLAETVKGRQCIEIGFGTGLLSMIALEQGAAHIHAWESDPYRYQLGQTVIDRLKLGGKITLHPGPFSCATEVHAAAVVFHEIIGSSLWNEGLRGSLPLGEHLIVPGEYQVEFDVLGMTRRHYREHFFPERTFTPNVKLPRPFVSLIQNLIDLTPRKVCCRQSYYDQLIPNQKLGRIEFYRIDFNTKRVVTGCDSWSFVLLPKEITTSFALAEYRDAEILILYPQSAIAHGQHRMDWSWYDPVIVDQPGNSVTISQDLDTGRFTAQP